MSVPEWIHRLIVLGAARGMVAVAMYSVRAGIGSTEMAGNTNVVLQAAVDHVAEMGGGTVEVLPGRYKMHDSLHLRDGVAVMGSGKVVLAGAFGLTSSLTCDGDYGEEQVTVADAHGWHVGMGIAVADSNANGFHTTVATVIGVEGNALLLNAPILADCMVASGAMAWNTFPVISGYHCEGVRVTGIEVEGMPEAHELNGCRGAGIFLYRCHSAVIEGCTVRDYPGDGISFQQSNDVQVRGCTCVGNLGHGLHPGSGSGTPHIMGCTSTGNANCGIFVCWRVKHGEFSGNTLAGNAGCGISIGHKDTDNLFGCNTIEGNGSWGVFARSESEPMAPHRNRFVGNTIADNGRASHGTGAVKISGPTIGWRFQGNEFMETRGPGLLPAVVLGPEAGEVELEGNSFAGFLVPQARTPR